MQRLRLKSGLLGICLMAGFLTPLGAQEPMPQAIDETYNTDYVTYTDQAMALYRKGQATQAIELMLKAYHMAPGNTSILNNLAACYIQRGVYYQNVKKDYKTALSDYRQALFYLQYDWPEQAPPTKTRDQNIAILKDNMEGAMKGAGLPPNDGPKHLELANNLRKQGRLAEAMVEYTWATKANPKLAAAWTGQGDIMMVRLKPTRAAEAYQKAVANSPNPSESLYIKLGNAYVKTQQPQKAVEAFNKALAFDPKNRDTQLALENIWNQEIKLNPRNMSAHLNLGVAYQLMGRYTDAFAQYQIAQGLAPGDPAVKLNIGSLYQAQGQLDQALQVYNALLQQYPSHPQALLYKADILKKQGKTTQAQQVFQTALQQAVDKKPILDQLMTINQSRGDAAEIKAGWKQYTQLFPNDANVQYRAGLAFHEQKDYDAAIDYYQTAIRLNPNLAEAYANLGTALHALGRDSEAVSQLKQAAKLNPDIADVNNLIGDIQKKQGSQALTEAAKLHDAGQYEAALPQYEAALRQTPNQAAIYVRYGLALQALKRYAQALTAYDKALALDTQDANTYYYKGTVYDEQNQLEKAKLLYEKALSLDSSLSQAQEALDGLKSASVDTQLEQALAAYIKKAYSQALTLVESVLKTDPDNATAYYYKGLVYDAQQKLEPARLAYGKAISLDPKLTDAVYALAVVLDTQGKKADAKKTYDQFIEQTSGQPEDDFIRYAKERAAAL